MIFVSSVLFKDYTLQIESFTINLDLLQYNVFLK